MVAAKKITDFKTNTVPSLSFGQRASDWWGSCCVCSTPSASVDEYTKHQIELKKQKDI